MSKQTKQLVTKLIIATNVNFNAFYLMSHQNLAYKLQTNIHFIVILKTGIILT